MNPPFNLHGETALITGGGTGLGLGMARCLTAAGAQVVLMGRTEQALQAAVAELGDRTAYVVHDVTDLDRTAQAFDAACAQAGAPVSILINNAGIHIKKAAVDTTPAELELMLQTHVVAAHTLTRAALPGMLERRHGSILDRTPLQRFGDPEDIGWAAVYLCSPAGRFVTGTVLPVDGGASIGF